jgi:hypothetical protein
MLLNCYKEIRCHGEVFLPKSGAKDGFYSVIIENYIVSYLFTMIRKGFLYKLFLTEKNVRKYHDAMLNRSDFSNAFDDIRTWNDFHENDEFLIQRAVGYKLMYGQLSTEIINYINNNNFKVIHLKRKDKLAQYLSKVRMKKTKVAHSSDNVVDIKKVNIPLGEFKEYLLSISDIESDIEKKINNCEIMNLFYEDINEEIDNVLSFLNVKDKERNIEKVKIKKMNKKSLEDSILNFEELKNFISIHKY